MLLLFSLALGCGQAHAYDVLCRDGNSSFEGFFAGIAVDVGPPTNGGLAERSCRAVLSWDDQELVVASGAAEIDLDLFAADLGTSYPVAAFQIKRTAAECCMTYKIYSLRKSPQLLRTLRGGGYFSAADTNLDGQVEIWTADVAAVDGFEGFRASQVQFPPTCVLRFEDGRLLDVSSEFEDYFDDEISRLRAMIHPQDLQRFKLSDGKLIPAGARSISLSAPLLATKLHVLELVWAYLYSHREKQAWQALAEMWPPQDRERIESAIMQMRARGMRTQLDGAFEAYTPPDQEIEHARIYDSTKKPAQPIMVRFYPSRGVKSVRGKLRVDLVIDCAGKVWSVKVSGKNKAAFDAVKASATNWKFIPAFIDHQPVASRLRMTISLEQ
jgi:hypothetical protein